MSRTVKDISQEIKEAFIANITLQEAYGLLPDKSFDDQFATSSIEAVLINIVASVIWLHESLWELFRKEMETLIDNSYVTSRPWYYQRALEFQNGDTLSFDESTYSFRYPTVDESKRIVKNVAIREVTDNNVTKLKIYFSDERKQPLTGDVRTAFEDYMRQIGAAGTHYLFVSQVPDELRVHLHIYYDPFVLDSTGERLASGGKPVEETIENYLDSLEYGGVFYASGLVDMLQATEGVKDVTLDATTWDGSKENRRKIDAKSGAFVYVRNESDITYAID